MDLGPVRDLALDLNLTAHGFAVTVSRPAPNQTPIVSRGLWQRPLAEPQAFGTDIKRRQPRRALVLPLTSRSILIDGVLTSVAGVPNAPRGTTITAPEKLGGTTRTWQVDGYSQDAENDRLIVAVILATAAS